MAITKDKKRDIIAKLEDGLSKATSAVFVRFNKLNVADTTAMRKNLRGEGVQYVVAKKTLLRKALEKGTYSGTIPELPGEVALAWGEGDATVPARGIHEHAKKFKGALSILGGIFESTFADAAKMTEIATIPSIQVLRGMFANIINSPRQRFAIALSEVAKTKPQA